MTLQLPSILKHKGIVILLLLSIIAIYKPVFGQVYPVQANINIIPPYTIYLHQYTSAEQQKLIVNILLHDPVVTSVDVRFRFTIEGGGVRIYTNPGWIPQPYSIFNGISSQIPGNIIAEYFQPQHIIVEGINPQEFYRTGRLPEGFYQFKVEVLEYQRGSIISNTGLAGVWLLLNESPRIVFPTPNQKVKATNPQMLNFTWVPGGISSPLSAMNTMYEFTMVEIPDQMDPTIAITTASDAIKFTRTLQQTSLFYGPGEPQLIPGKKYAVRVRAFDTEGLEIFKNNGYSEVRVFQFGETCNSPISFDLNDETQSTFNIEVQTDPSNTAWQANFRESESTDWSELKAEGSSTEKTVRGLKASTAYEVQLKGLCGPFASDFTYSKTITTKERTNTQQICENTISPFVVKNALPLPQLKKDHIFLAALVPIKVSQVTKQGGGKFSGNGIATLPFFNAGLAVTFDDIQINDLMQLTSGEVNVVRNAFNPTFFGDELPPTDGTGGGSNPDSTGNGTWPPFTDTIKINVPFDSIVVVNDSTIWVIPSGGGEAIVVDLGGSTCTLILPSDGNLNNAQVVYNGAARPYNSSNSNDGSLEQFTGFLANFEPSPTQAYGFDSLKYSGFADYYNEMDVNGKVFKMPWKALAPNSYEPVNLKIRRSSESFPYSDLKVGIWGGGDLVPVMGINTAIQTYNLKGANEGDEFAVVAKFNSDDKEVNAGGIWAVTYQPKSFNLYIVALEGSNIDEECARMQNEITTIYKQALVSWSVKPLYGFKSIALGDNGLDWTDSELLSAYNTEMNSVISAFKDWHPNSDPDAYYMIVVPKFSDNTVEAFMPRNRRFGFISADQLYSRNVAHELGHGAFNLRHTFPEVQQYSTDNLMDYPPTGGQPTQDKYALLKAQWDLIHNPESTTGLFDEMEDGASLCLGIFDDCKNVLKILKQIKSAVETKEKIKIDYVSNSKKRIFKASSLEVEDEIFQSIKIVYTPIFKDVLVDPTQYSKVDRDAVDDDGKTYRQKGFDFISDNKSIFTIEIVANDVVYEEKYESLRNYLFGDTNGTTRTITDTIKIFITRTFTGSNSTTGILKTDDETITGYTVELPRGTDSQCKNSCDDIKVPFDCYCIIEGTYDFILNETGKYPGESLRLEPNKNIPNDRSGILIHKGRDDAKGWSQGCILTMPNEPEINSDLYSANRKNTQDESQEFIMRLREWVTLRENSIRKKKPEIKSVTKKIIITKTF